MRTIKFSKCPIGKHKGERWPKLSRIDVSKPIILNYVCVIARPTDANEVFWKSDTFDDFTENEISELLFKFYGIYEPAMLILQFVQGDDIAITTARAYEWRKHKYYLHSIGKEFMVVET